MKINYHSNWLSDNILSLHNELKHPNGHYLSKETAIYILILIITSNINGIHDHNNGIEQYALVNNILCNIGWNVKFYIPVANTHRDHK